MSETPTPTVVPYADFLARRERRARALAEQTRPLDPPPIEDDPLPKAIAVARPGSGENT